MKTYTLVNINIYIYIYIYIFINIYIFPHLSYLRHFSFFKNFPPLSLIASSYKAHYPRNPLTFILNLVHLYHYYPDNSLQHAMKLSYQNLDIHYLFTYLLFIFVFTIHYTMHYALCTMHYVLCIIYYALCTMHYALCTMHYLLCTMHYALFIRIHTYSLFYTYSYVFTIARDEIP